MICAKCGYDNRSNEKFCPQCGAIQDFKKVDINKINTEGLELADEENKKAETSIGHRKRFNIALTVVLLIIFAVLAALAVPYYYSGLKADKIVAVTTIAREKIVDYARRYRQWPDSAEDIDFDAGRLTGGMFNVAINNGIIEVTIPEEPGKTARIIPEADESGRITWSCDNGGIGPDYLPPGCFK